MPTWIDDEGRLRERADDKHQFLSHIPLEFLDPWTSYDAWDAELAIRLITIGYNLDIQGYWDDAKDFPYGSTGWDSARAYVDVYQRGMSIAQSSIAAGLLKGHDTPANWLAWAKRKGYDVAHLECPQTAPATDTAPPAPVADNEWKVQAQTRALEIIKESKKRDLYPNQESLGDQIASEFRKAGTVGADGKPLSGATIKRHALGGISSAANKQLSTTIGRGK